MKSKNIDSPSMGATREILLPLSTSEELVASMEKAEELVATSETAEEPTAPTEKAENDTTSPEAMTDINATPDVPEDVSTQAKETTPELPTSSETTEEHMPEEPTEIMHNYVPPFSEHIHKITSDTPTCEIIIMSPADLEDKMAHGWDDAVRSYDEPSEALLNSPEYRDSMIVKPEDLFDDPANLINEFRRIIAEKDAELEEKERIIETLRGGDNGNIGHAAILQAGETEQPGQPDAAETSPVEEDVMLTVNEAAKHLKVGMNKMYALTKFPDFPCEKQGRKFVVSKVKLDAWKVKHPNFADLARQLSKKRKKNTEANENEKDS